MSKPARKAVPDAVSRRALLARSTFLIPGLVYVTIFMAIPVCFILAYSFMSRGTYGGVITNFSFDNYHRFLDPVYFQVFLDSIKLAFIATLLALLLGFPAAYAITLLKAKWQKLALIFIVLPFWTNFLIRTYAWIVLLNTEGFLNKALIYVGAIDRPFSILYTQPAVVIGLLYGYLPLMILPIYSTLEKIDPALREAAINLGASRRQAFLRVTLPLAAPGVMLGAIFVFVPSVGNFVVPELLGGGKTVMVGNLIRDQFLKARDWPFGSVLALSLVLLLVLLFSVQSRITRRIVGSS